MSERGLPYVLGCPSWSEAAWQGALYPAGVSSSAFLEHYVRVFNGVEGNTTFYARPAAATVQRWASIMPPDFRFCAKFPRDISHAEDLGTMQAAAVDFVHLLAPLSSRLNPLWLQLPARFTAPRLPELVSLLETLTPLSIPLAVEVRHLEFFAKGEAERSLNRLLRDYGVERICLDSRALFSCSSSDPAVLHAQGRKPRLPVRPAALTQSPQVRFIGRPELEANDPFLKPWIDKLAEWIEAGLTPHIYLHTPDNRRAPELARRFHGYLMERLPGLPELNWPEPEQRQPSLFD